MSTELKDWKHLEVHAGDGVAIVRLNRPEKRNAMSLEMMEELIEVAQQLSKDTSVHAVVLAASGKNFSAGVDISPGGMLQGRSDTLLEKRQQARIGSDLCSAWQGLEQVTVAAIEGHCIGGGLALVLACDFRIAGDSAWFKLPEVALGINMSWHSLPRMVALVGPSKAKQVAIFGENISAVDAESWGLVDRLVDDEKAFDEASKWAKKAAAMPPIPVRMIKEAVNATALALAHATSHMDRDQALLAVQSDDFKEGVEAFVENRKPTFTGN